MNKAGTKTNGLSLSLSPLSSLGDADNNNDDDNDELLPPSLHTYYESDSDDDSDDDDDDVVELEKPTVVPSCSWSLSSLSVEFQIKRHNLLVCYGHCYYCTY